MKWFREYGVGYLLLLEEMIRSNPKFGVFFCYFFCFFTFYYLKMTEMKEYLFKILVVGDLGTGKTSIIRRYVHNIFSTNYKSTIGVDFALKVIQWTPDIIVRLQLWDIAGQERFGNMTRVYYKEALGAIVVYDITRPQTFEGVTRWKKDIDAKVALPDAWGGGQIPVILLANKTDLIQEGHGQPVNPAELDNFCREHGFIQW
ncbi:Putative Ras-like protein Rab-32 [Rhizopus microsporus]|nr:Putative Ras-like protein Rab-32 [Rhizopus microsporus]